MRPESRSRRPDVADPRRAARLRREFRRAKHGGESWKHPDHWFMTNVVSTVRLHERLRHCDFIRKYVHVTTPEVYGSTEGFIREDAPFRPSTPYAVSRAAGDMSLRTFFEAYEFPVVFTRAANVYGPGSNSTVSSRARFFSSCWGASSSCTGRHLKALVHPHERCLGCHVARCPRGVSR